MRVVSLRISEDLYQWLKEKAEEDKRSLNKEVTYLLGQLKEKEPNGKDESM